MKKIISFLLCVIFVFSLCACSTQSTEKDNKLSIVTSCFPAYDFAREICKEYADITLLLKPGQEAHDYEPTPNDIIKIQKCDLFICVGGENEKWVEALTENNPKLNIIKMLDIVEEEHDHNDHEHTHEHTHDEHVWTSPVNAKTITEEIFSAVCEISLSNVDIFNKNFDEYIKKITELDLLFSKITNNATSKTIVFADRFPVRHFTDEYNLEVLSAFPGCNSNTEPSATAVTDLIKNIKEKNISAVFYTEFSNKKMAETIISETGCKSLLFHSCHNVTKSEFESGESYYSLMKKNAENLKTALS